MKIGFAFFRLGAAKAEYGLDFDLSAVPQTGDIIIVRRPDTPSDEIHPDETFRVRRTQWGLKTPISKEAGTRKNRVGSAYVITVECEQVDPLSH
jgi:hypothetical protein